MSRSAHLIFVPGLTDAQLPAARALRALAPRISRLRCSFPCLPAVVQASATLGLRPLRHGVTSDATRASNATAPTWAGQRDVVIENWSELRLALQAAPPASASVEQAVIALDDRLAARLRNASEEHVVVVCGGPAFEAVRGRIDTAELANDATSQGALLWVRAEGDRQMLRDALLRRPGVERTFSNAALEMWGAPTLDEDEMLFLAEPHWSFDLAEASVCGRPMSEARPIVLVAGGGGPAWPSEVHDYRLAPSLARFLGVESPDFDDRPLPL